MADEPLSKAEIDVLLGRCPQQSADQIASTDLEALKQVHEVAARAWAGELSALLRRTVRVRLAGIGPAISGTVAAASDTSSYVGRFDVRPLNTSWLVEIRPSILFPLIDCMLGGGHEPVEVARRRLTEIEKRLAARVAWHLATALEHAWAARHSLTIECGEANSEGLSGTGSPLVSVGYELELATVRGRVTLSIPAGDVGRLLASVCDAESPQVEIVALLAESSAAEVACAELAVGDIIATGRRASEPVAVSQSGQPRFHARLGACQGHKAVEIVEVLSDAETRDDSPTAQE